MFSPVEAFLLLSYTGMVYVLLEAFRLSCSLLLGFLVVIVHRDGVCSLLVEAFLMLSYTGMVYVLSCRGFLVVIVTGMVYLYRGFLVVIVHMDGVCSLL